MKLYKLDLDFGKEEIESQESQLKAEIKENWVGLLGTCNKIVYQGEEEGVIREFLSLGFWEGDLHLIPIIPRELQYELEEYEMDTFPVPEELIIVDLPVDVTVKVPHPVAELITFLQMGIK